MSWNQPDLPSYINTQADLDRWNQAADATLQVTQGRTDPELTQAFYWSTLGNQASPEPSDAVTEAFNEDEHRIPKGLPHAGEWESLLDQIHLEKTPPAPEDLDESFREPKPGPIAQRFLYGNEDTKQMYSTLTDDRKADENDYIPTRLQQHQDFIDYMLQGHPSFEHPEAVILAGGTSSGKTRLLRDRPDLSPPGAVHIDPDDAKYRGIPEFQPMLEGREPYAAWAVHRESGDIVHKLTAQAMAGHHNLVIDTTGDREPGEFRKQITDLTDKGYHVRIVYVNETTDKAVAGSMSRSVHTFRVVPPQVVRGIHQRVSERFKEIRDLPDTEGSGVRSVSILDHEHDDGAPGGLIYHNETGEPEKIIHPQAFQRFLDKADEKKVPLAITESAHYDDGEISPVIVEMPHDWPEWMHSQRLNDTFTKMMGGKNHE